MPTLEKDKGGNYIIELTDGMNVVELIEALAKMLENGQTTVSFECEESRDVFMEDLDEGRLISYV